MFICKSLADVSNASFNLYCEIIHLNTNNITLFKLTI